MKTWSNFRAPRGEYNELHYGKVHCSVLNLHPSFFNESEIGGRIHYFHTIDHCKSYNVCTAHSNDNLLNALKQWSGLLQSSCAVHYSTVQCRIVQGITVQGITVQCIVRCCTLSQPLVLLLQIECNDSARGASHYAALHYTAVHLTALHFTTLQRNCTEMYFTENCASSHYTSLVLGHHMKLWYCHKEYYDFILQISNLWRTLKIRLNQTVVFKILHTNGSLFCFVSRALLLGPLLAQ